MRTQRSSSSAPVPAPPQPTKRPLPPPTPRPAGNRVLASLPLDLQQRLNSAGSRVVLEKSAVLIEAGAPLTHVYFPGSGLLSLQTATHHGNSVEVAMIGREGVTLPLAAIAGTPAAYTTVVTAAGEALVLPADVL